MFTQKKKYGKNIHPIGIIPFGIIPKWAKKIIQGRGSTGMHIYNKRKIVLTNNRKIKLEIPIANSLGTHLNDSNIAKCR